METLIIRQKLIDRLVQNNKKNKFLLSADTSNVDWSNLKLEIQQNLDKLKKGAKTYEILSYILMAITGVIALIKLFTDSGPDLNKGAFCFFSTNSS